VCATFIATGIVTDVDRMGRILKLLISALENFSSKSIHFLALVVSNPRQAKQKQQPSAIFVVSARTHRSWSRCQCSPLGQSFKLPVRSRPT
jgi:hypothetical protein